MFDAKDSQLLQEADRTLFALTWIVEGWQRFHRRTCECMRAHSEPGRNIAQTLQISRSYPSASRVVLQETVCPLKTFLASDWRHLHIGPESPSAETTCQRQLDLLDARQAQCRGRGKLGGSRLASFRARSKILSPPDRVRTLSGSMARTCSIW